MRLPVRVVRVTLNERYPHSTRGLRASFWWRRSREASNNISGCLSQKQHIRLFATLRIACTWQNSAASCSVQATRVLMPSHFRGQERPVSVTNSNVSTRTHRRAYPSVIGMCGEDLLQHVRVISRLLHSVRERRVLSFCADRKVLRHSCMSWTCSSSCSVESRKHRVASNVQLLLSACSVARPPRRLR